MVLRQEDGYNIDPPCSWQIDRYRNTGSPTPVTTSNLPLPIIIAPPVDWEEVVLDEADVPKIIHTVPAERTCRIMELSVTHKGIEPTKVQLSDGTNVKTTILCPPGATVVWGSQTGRKFTAEQNVQVKSSNVIGGNTRVSGSGYDD